MVEIDMGMLGDFELEPKSVLAEDRMKDGLLIFMENYDETDRLIFLNDDLCFCIGYDLAWFHCQKYLCRKHWHAITQIRWRHGAYLVGSRSCLCLHRPRNSLFCSTQCTGELSASCCWRNNPWRCDLWYLRFHQLLNSYELAFEDNINRFYLGNGFMWTEQLNGCIHSESIFFLNQGKNIGVCF